MKTQVTDTAQNSGYLPTIRTTGRPLGRVVSYPASACSSNTTGADWLTWPLTAGWAIAQTTN